MYQTVPNGTGNLIPSDTIRLIPTIPLVPSLNPTRLGRLVDGTPLPPSTCASFAAQQPRRFGAFRLTGDSGFFLFLFSFFSLVSIRRNTTGYYIHNWSHFLSFFFFFFFFSLSVLSYFWTLSFFDGMRSYLSWFRLSVTTTSFYGVLTLLAYARYYPWIDYFCYLLYPKPYLKIIKKTWIE